MCLHLISMSMEKQWANLSKKENSIHQADLSSFYKKYPKINSELSKEDLIRYIRLTIKILNKK